MSDLRVVVLTVPEDVWMDDGNGDRLLAILVINGTFHHLEAIRVIEDDDGVQKAASEDLAETFDAMFQIGGEGAFDTVTIRGTEYVLVVTPFQ
jgi:hypothetical protein